MNIRDFARHKQSGEKISMITCYDYASAIIACQSDIDCLLIGDSVAMVMYGHDSTLMATTEMICNHVEAVARAVKKTDSKKFILADMPFLSYRKSLGESVEAAGMIMRAGANAVKIESAKGNIETTRHLIESGIPVMGHIGLTPQFVNQFGGFRVQGKSEESAKAIKDEALAFYEAGCFALLLEGVPQELAKEITAISKIATIGIGAGSGCDGQVLVWQDFLGMFKDLNPKFLRKFANLQEPILKAINDFNKAVKSGDFPNSEEAY